jgi:hypothetical protein
MSNEYTFVYTTDVAEDGLAGHALMVTPNPARDVATVSMPAVAGRVVEIIDIAGRTIASVAAEDGVHEVRFDLQSVARGTYIVRMRAGQSMWMTRLVRD